MKSQIESQHPGVGSKRIHFDNKRPIRDALQLVELLFSNITLTSCERLKGGILKKEIYDNQSVPVVN